jgi:hypothetical protein
MSDADGKRNLPTVPLNTATGNALFEKAVVAVGLDENTTRWLFVSVLNTVGVAPSNLTPEELGNLLPEVDRRLRKLVQEAQADGAMRRLYRVLFEQAEPA